jgi:hypothetical protein
MEISDNNEINNENKNIETKIQDETDECIELRNIKYKTMLINGVTLNESKSSQSICNLDKFLENEKNNNENEPWCKLNKTIKIKKLTEYVTSVYKNENNLDESECDNLITFLKDCLDRKKLQRIKDVSFDKENGKVKDIPALTYVRSTKHFTLKNIEKRISTLKSLPQKNNKKTNNQKTIKNKMTAPDYDNHRDEDDKNDGISEK